MNLIEKIIEDKIKRYGIPLLAFFVILSVFLLSWLKSWFISWLKLPFDMPGIFDSVLLLIGWILLIIIFLWIWEKISSFYSVIRVNFKNKIN